MQLKFRNALLTASNATMQGTPKRKKKKKTQDGLVVQQFGTYHNEAPFQGRTYIPIPSYDGQRDIIDGGLVGSATVMNGGFF